MPYICTGAWYSHSECILLSLLGSETPSDRLFAVNMILEVRGSIELGDLLVQERRMPKLNLKATSLQNMIDWDAKEVKEQAEQEGPNEDS